jgi:hypothetical protein
MSTIASKLSLNEPLTHCTNLEGAPLIMRLNVRPLFAPEEIAHQSRIRHALTRQNS